MKATQPLFEQFRPRVWSDVIGQAKAINRLSALSRRGLHGRGYWISGPSGSGKTTIARLIAADVCGGGVEGALMQQEVDGQALTLTALRDAEESLSTIGWATGGRALIVNEAHGLRSDTIRHLLIMLEALPPHAVVIFTTTSQAMVDLFGDKLDSGPLLSRCIGLELVAPTAREIAERCRAIAMQEGLAPADADLSPFILTASRLKCNFRAVLNEVEAGAFA